MCIYSLLFKAYLVSLFVLPKAGVLEPWPITINIGILFILAALSLRKFFIARFNDRQLLIVFCQVLFLCYIIVMLMLRGHESLGMALSLVLLLGLTPILISVICARVYSLSDVRVHRLHKIAAICVLAGAIVAIIQFLAVNHIGYVIFIKGVTANVDSPSELLTKYNYRGDGLYKGFGFFNNGNLLGISMVMGLSLFLSSSLKNRMKATGALLIICAILLSISRTAYLGLTVFFLCMGLRGILKSPMTVSVSRWEISAVAFLLFIVISLGVMLSIGLVPVGIETLVARLGFIEDNRSIVSLTGGSGPIGDITELTYVSILANLGIIGLLLFSLSTILPLVFTVSPTISFLRNGITPPFILLCGGISYCIMMLVDGAVQFTPVLFVYWLIILFAYRLSRLSNRQRNTAPIESFVQKGADCTVCKKVIGKPNGL